MIFDPWTRGYLFGYCLGIAVLGGVLVFTYPAARRVLAGAMRDTAHDMQGWADALDAWAQRSDLRFLEPSTSTAIEPAEKAIAHA